MVTNHSWHAKLLPVASGHVIRDSPRDSPGFLASSGPLSLWLRDSPRVGVNGSLSRYGYGLTYNIDEHLTNIHDNGVVTFPLGIPHPGTVLVSERRGFTKSYGFFV